MKRTTLDILFGIGLFFFGSAVHADAQDMHREITRGKEKELSVIVDVSFGSITLERGKKDNIVILDYREDNDETNKLDVSYDVDGDKGRLRVRLKKSSSRLWDDDEDSDNHHHDRKLRLQLTDALPMSLELELGAGKGDIDLSGLRIKDLKISSGASSVDLRCDKPNPITSDRIDIESGVSRFTATNLCNTNFRRLKFSGGVGAYKLDFGGTLRQDASVHVEVGLGSIVVYIPKEIATKLLYDDSWFSSFDLDRDFSKVKSGVYETESAENAKKLTIQIESGLGSVKVRRR